jgi:TonB family protein
MKTKIPLLACISILLATIANAQTAPEPAQWTRYTAKGEEFSVTLPAPPEMTTAKILIPRCNKKARERAMKTWADGVLYSVYSLENLNPKQSLEEFIVEQTAKSAVDPASERSLTIDGFAGKEYAPQDKTSPATEQFFATKGRLYRFVVIGAASDDPRVRQFFSSIALGKKQKGMEVSDGPGAALGPNTAEALYIGKEVDRKARLLAKPEPSYTDAAKENAIVGTVILKVVFASTGQVTNIRVAQALPYGLTEKAIAAAKKIKFIPAMKDGHYVSMWMQLEYNFNLY